MIARLKQGGLFGFLAASFVVVGAISSLVVLLVVLPTLESSVRDDRLNRQQDRVTGILREASAKAAAGFADQAGADAFLESIAAGLPGQVRIVTRGGGIPSSAGPNYLPARVSGDVDLVLGLGQVVSGRFTVGGQDVVHVTAPVAAPGEPPIAVLEAAVPVDASIGEVGVIRRRIFLAIVAVLLLAATAGLLLARFIVGRIGALARTAHSLAQGDLSARARGSSPRELSMLGDSLNSMATRLDALVAETRAERDRAQGLVTSLTEGVLAVGADGEVTVANEAARRYLNLPDGDLAIRVDDLPREVVGVAREVMNGERESVMTEVVLPSGTELALTVVTPHDQAAGVVVTMREVTEQRRLERARRELVANVSHELKTPVSAIRGFLELMEDERLPDDRREEFLDLMSGEVARLERLIEEQLELARVDSGTLPLEREATDLRALVEGIGESRRALAERDGVQVHVDVPDEPVVVHIDGARIEQIALILADNALRHTPAGGRVTLTVRGYGDVATLTVTDTGEGIPHAAQPFVFDRYYQADPSREGSGAGLGLAIARGLARAHGGDLSLTSAPGVGSSFLLRLPLTAATPEDGPQPAGIAQS